MSEANLALPPCSAAKCEFCLEAHDPQSSCKCAKCGCGLHYSFIRRVFVGGEKKAWCPACDDDVAIAEVMPSSTQIREIDGCHALGGTSWDCVNEFVHHPDVTFEDMQGACLQLAAELERVRQNGEPNSGEPKL